MLITIKHSVLIVLICIRSNSKPIVIPSTGIMKVFDYFSKLNMKRKCKQHNCICLGVYGLNYLEEDGDMNVNDDESYSILLKD